MMSAFQISIHSSCTFFLHNKRLLKKYTFKVCLQHFKIPYNIINAPSCIHRVLHCALFPASDASLFSQKSFPASPAHADAFPLPAATFSLPFLVDASPSLVAGQLSVPDVHNNSFGYRDSQARYLEVVTNSCFCSELIHYIVPCIDEKNMFYVFL